MTTVTVFGGSGFIGSHIAHAFRLAGWQVKAPLRPGSDGSFLASMGASTSKVDLDRQTAIEEAIEPAGLVVNAMAAPRDASPAQFTAIELELTERVLRAAARRQASGYLQLSSIIAYGRDLPPGGIDESYTPRPVLPIDRFSLERERTVRRIGDELGLPWVLVQPVSLLGRRDRGGFIQSLVERHRSGAFPLVRGGRARMSLMDARDAGEVFVWIADRLGLFAGQAVLAKGFDTSWRELKAALDLQAGRQMPAKSLPYHVLWLAGAAADLLGGRGGLSRRTVSILGNDRLYHDNRLRSSGYSPRYDLPEAIAYALSP